MTPQHSPGPWKIWNAYGPAKKDGSLRAVRIGPDGGGGITGSEGYDLVGTEDDFLLVASAPSLLATCRAALTWRVACPGCGTIHTHGHTDSCACDHCPGSEAMIAAIARAEGRTS